MQQERGSVGGGRVEDMKGMQQQDRRGPKPHQENQQQQQPPPPPQQPQKCPRCESLNTKFCYYNNYSLSQPRYFCKTCRRYWTQGGTLRNVPVGGGCRKGKRSKKPSSSDNLNNPSQQQQQSNLTITTTTPAINAPSRSKGTETISSSPIPSIPTVGSQIYYPSGGFLSSLAAIQSFNQPINVGSDFGGSNLALLQGFSVPSFNSQLQPPQLQQQHLQLHQPHVFNMGSSDALEDNVIQPNRPSTSHQDWPQSFNSNNSNQISSQVGYWSSSGSNTSTSIGSSLNPTHWTDLSGFGPPPPPSSSSPSFL